MTAKLISGDRHFLEAFMTYLMDDARWMPKVQLERIIGPLLTPIIEDLLNGVAGHQSRKAKYELSARANSADQSRGIPLVVA